MRTRRRWEDLSPRGRRLVVAAGAVEAVLTAAALRDLARRPPEQVRGPRWRWALLAFVQPVGPLAYFLRGRR